MKNKKLITIVLIMLLTIVSSSSFADVEDVVSTESYLTLHTRKDLENIIDDTRDKNRYLTYFNTILQTENIRLRKDIKQANKYKKTRRMILVLSITGSLIVGSIVGISVGYYGMK